MVLRILVVLLAAVVGAARAADLPRVQAYPAPAGPLVAKVAMHPSTEEFTLDVLGADGGRLHHEDYTSESGEHGLVLDQAAWTRDGGFFVYTTTSSGGHSAWQHLSYFYSVADNRVHDFSDFFPAVASARFSVGEGDLITLTIWTPLDERHPLDESVALPITFHLSDLVGPKGVRSGAGAE